MPSNSREKELHQRIKSLSDAFLLSSKTSDYKSILRAVTKHFKVFTGADASVLMLNNDDGALTPECSLGIPFSRIKDARLPLSTRLKDIISRPVLDVRYASFLNTPLIHNRKLIGVLAVFSIAPEKFHAFEHDKYEGVFLTTLASYIAVIIENVTLTNTVRSYEHSQSDWENTFNAIDDLISIHDKNFTILRANNALSRKLNLDITDIIGKKCYKIFHGTDEPPKVCPCDKSRETKTKCSEDIEFSKIHGVFNVTTYPLFNDEGNYTGIIHMAKDVTEHKKLWNQIIQSEKISALGMMIAWIAHEINNPLSVIMGYTQSLLKADGENHQDKLTSILKNADRASGTVKHLLGFIRQGETTKIPIDIHQVIDEAISWFLHKLKVQSIRLVKEYDTFPLIVSCHENQMQQAFLNIIGNALDAMEYQRNIEKILLIKTERKDGSAKVFIKDTGCGISKEDTQRIFEPFFTTKKTGKGTGLGLPICCRTIQEHEGTIQVFSQHGKGATFIINLPLFKKD